MTSKTVTSLAFAAGCALAFAAMPAAQAQSYPPPGPGMQYTPAPPPPAQAQSYPPPGPGMQYTPAPPPPAGPPELVTNGPQASRGDFGDWSARRNNIDSAHYDRLLQTSPGFRQARMRRECGPISDPDLRGQCLASFQQYEPVMYGSSYAPRHHRYHPGYGR